MVTVSAIYSAPTRLIPQGWSPPGWVEDKDKNIFTPPGVRFFTPKEALEVSALCPALFPDHKELEELTAFFCLTILASSNRMAYIRTVTEHGEGPIVAVAMLVFFPDLVHGRDAHIRAVVSLSHMGKASQLREMLTRFLQKLMKEEEYLPYAHR